MSSWQHLLNNVYCLAGKWFNVHVDTADKQKAVPVSDVNDRLCENQEVHKGSFRGASRGYSTSRMVLVQLMALLLRGISAEGWHLFTESDHDSQRLSRTVLLFS